jgi:hypothetical protein
MPRVRTERCTRGRGGFHLLKLVLGALEADADSIDFAEPALPLGVLVLAWGAVGAGAHAEFDFAPLEMAEELLSFLPARLPVFHARAQQAASADERPVVLDQPPRSRRSCGVVAGVVHGVSLDVAEPGCLQGALEDRCARTGRRSRDGRGRTGVGSDRAWAGW